ncbi:MAG: ABC transporter substrate-binding protein, partial [Burkholderiales bacterium]
MRRCIRDHRGRLPANAAAPSSVARLRRGASSISLSICRRVAFGCLLPLFAQAQEIVVGQTLSLTGPSATIAQDLLRGRQACIDLINSQGGIRGRPLKLVTRDDRNDGVRAVQLAQDLVDREDAAVMLGSMGPVVNAALLKWSGTNGMAVVGPYGGDIEIRVPDSGTAFFLTANQSAEAARLASHIASLGLTRVVVVHATDKSGRAALTALEEALGVSNVAAVALIPVNPDASDAGVAARAVVKASAQAVLLATSGRATVAMLKSLTTATSGGLSLMQVYGFSSAASQAELLELGAQARGFSMSQVVPLPRDTRLPMVATFQTAMRNIKGERTYAELEGCIAPLLLADVLRRKPIDLNRAGVLRAMKAAGRVNLGGF